MNEWISVKDRIPEIPEGKRCVEVQVCWKNHDGKLQVMAMDWAQNSYAATVKGRTPRWEWRERLSLWEPIYWKPLSDAPEEGSI